MIQKRTIAHTNTVRGGNPHGNTSTFVAGMLVFGTITLLLCCITDPFEETLPLILIIFFGTLSLLCLFATALSIESKREISCTISITGKKPSAMSNRWKRILNEMYSASCEFYNFISELDRTPRITKIINEIPGMEAFKGNNCFTVKLRLAVIVYCDLRDCFRELGHLHTDLYNLEGIGYSMLIGQLMSNDINPSIFMNPKTTRKFTEIIEKLELDLEDSVKLDVHGHENEFRFGVIFGKAHGEWDLVHRYSTLMYRWASLIAKADGSVSTEESAVLAAIVKMNEDPMKGNVTIRNSGTSNVRPLPCTANSNAEVRNSIVNRPKESMDAMKSLDSLIGLDSVKAEVRKLACFIKIQRERKFSGLAEVPISYHCVFTGNPGTGKTTVARILADIYREMGIIKKGHLVETDRSGLVAEYVGQTAIKTNKVIDSALDGILFIDEAYSLVGSGGMDYGAEAIATLLKRMEDDRKRLIVILAGYTEEMKNFIDSNPGLHSRFNRYIHFPDYSAKELSEIFLMKSEQCQYRCTDELKSALSSVMEEAVHSQNRNFGNGRYVRNLFESTVQKQAQRLSTVAPLTSKMLEELTLDDLIG